MVSAIGGGGAMPPMNNNAMQAKPLSDEQKQFVTDTLSAYDPDSLTAEKAKEITSLFQEQGIAPGRGLAGAMAEAGFDARNVGQLAGVQPPSGGQPPSEAGAMAAGTSASSATSDVLSFLSQLLEQQGNEPLSEDSKQNILQALHDRFGFTADNIINERA